MIIVAIVICVVLLVCALVFTYEMVTAPTLNEYGRVIADPYGRLGPKFKHGDPIPEEHHGKRWL